MSLPNVTICVPFRDSAAYIGDFARLIEALDYPPDHLRINCIEGDSVDNSHEILDRWAGQYNQAHVFKYDTHHKKYPSVISPERFAHLSKVFNFCLESVDFGWSDYSLIIPGDVTFSPDLVMQLVMAEQDVISPMFWIGDMANGNCRFYDIWGFIRHGKNFRGYPLAWYEQHMEAEPFQMDYVGGAMLCSRRVIEAGARYTAEKVDHGLCDTARENGFTIWCHPGAHIFHR